MFIIILLLLERYENTKEGNRRQRGDNVLETSNSPIRPKRAPDAPTVNKVLRKIQPIQRDGIYNIDLIEQ